MKQTRLMQSVLGSLVVLLSLVGCAVPEPMPTSTSVATPTPTAVPTFTPDPCTGWSCTVAGVVYAETVHSGNELEGATVTLNQSSYCSRTRGQQQVKTGRDGRFEFGDVFLHDTDRIQIKVESEGHETGQWDSVDRYCLFCNCFREPIEIVLRIVPGP